MEPITTPTGFTAGTDPHTTEAADIATMALAAAEPSPLDEAGRFVSVVVPPGGAVRVFDLDAARETTAAHPKRKQGAYLTHTAASFAEYVNRHATDHTEVFADERTASLVAVLDSHAAGDTDDVVDLPGHSEHTVLLKLRPTEAWEAWTKNQGLTDQASFAEHVEDRLPEIIEPDAATFLEIAQTLTASTTVDFESAHRLTDGQTSIAYRETINATAGQKHALTIPERFAISVAPWQGADPWKITGRLRYRIRDGRLHIGYKLDNLDALLTAAFTDIVEEIAAGIDTVPVFHGWPHSDVRIAMVSR